ncbi:glycosyltransferase [Prochlorococcus marinus]|uniref:glycosyltransferase family protein n=1 Tax=Prochlorococcus TaxID=1218 RepID=UPI0007B34920|nr:glycosyltransferase [Prochlorococcus marinus]
MTVTTILFHYGAFQPLWQQQGLLQAGPQIANQPHGLSVPNQRVDTLISALQYRGLPIKGVLLHYTDPFLIRSAPLRGLREWPGPRLLACGDLHHGSQPINSLADYLTSESHDAVLLTFNPALVDEVSRRVSIPVRALPPTFFRYPRAIPDTHSQRLELLHVGSLGPHHPQRRELVTALHSRGQVPCRHATTNTAEEAAELYAQHCLVLNVPLNNDLNHRFFEVMAAGVPQVVFGDPGLVGDYLALAERPDVFWASSIEELETLVLKLFAEPEKLRSIPVNPPTYLALKELLKAALAP